MTLGIQLKNIVWNCITYSHCLKSHKHYVAYNTVGKGLFNVSKITNEHRPSCLCSNFIFLTLSRVLVADYKQNFG